MRIKLTDADIASIDPASPLGQRIAQNLQPAVEAERVKFVAMAQDQCTSDDIEVDDDAELSGGDPNGTWVQAWVFLHYANCTTCGEPVEGTADDEDVVCAECQEDAADEEDAS